MVAQLESSFLEVHDNKSQIHVACLSWVKHGRFQNRGDQFPYFLACVTAEATIHINTGKERKGAWSLQGPQGGAYL